METKNFIQVLVAWGVLLLTAGLSFWAGSKSVVIVPLVEVLPAVPTVRVEPSSATTERRGGHGPAKPGRHKRGAQRGGGYGPTQRRDRTSQRPAADRHRCAWGEGRGIVAAAAALARRQGAARQEVILSRLKAEDSWFRPG